MAKRDLLLFSGSARMATVRLLAFGGAVLVIQYSVYCCHLVALSKFKPHSSFFKIKSNVDRKVAFP
jgi:hypothetical protein